MTEQKNKQVSLPTVTRTVKEIQEEMKDLTEERQRRLNQLAGADPIYRDFTGRIEALAWLLETT